MTRALSYGLFFLALLFSSVSVAADDEVSTLRALDSGGAALLQTTRTTLADGKLGAVVTVQELDEKLAAKGTAIKIYDGPFVIATLATRASSAAILMFRGGSAPFVKLALVDLTSGKFKTLDLARTAGAGFMPTAAAGCADAEGFTFLWQEQNNGAVVQASLVRVKPDGTYLKKPTNVEATWPLGAIVDDGRGYTMALRYDGATPDQTRIAFVTLGYEGAPEQHPWWGARPTMVSDIQMLMVKGVATAVYRSGDSKKAILAIGANKDTGQWGKEAEASKVLFAKNADAPFFVRVKNGAIELLQP